MAESLTDLAAFIAVAKDRSFTSAAARLGLSQSSLSRTIRKLEERIGVRLLTRTTRSVTPTDAGARLLASVGPRLEEIDAEVEALSAFRDRPAGTIRINTGENSLNTILWPFIEGFAARYPDIKIEVDVDSGLIDIVERGYDAGVRLGEQVAKDMIATRIGPDWRMAVVGSPKYFATRAVPLTPDDLTGHNCIKLRLVTFGGFYAWEFEKDGRRLNVRVDGQLAFNGTTHVLEALLAGHGIGCVPEDTVQDHLQSGRLIQVLQGWMPTFQGYHLYYPSRQHSAAFQLFVDGIRYRDR
jgi:DNA-binding transcriptional LysR family regulator